jgi:hypothetical protein
MAENKNIRQAKKVLDELDKKEKEVGTAIYLPGYKNKRMKDMTDDEFIRNKRLNDIEEEREVQIQRMIDEYPKGAEDWEGRKSKNPKGEGKLQFSKGGMVKSKASSRADGCAKRGKTRGRMC